MSDYEIFAWDGNDTYYLTWSYDREIETVDDLADAQGLPFPVVRQYDATSDELRGWDYLDSIIRMGGGGHLAERIELYCGETTADELLTTATMRDPNELGKDIDLTIEDRR